MVERGQLIGRIAFDIQQGGYQPIHWLGVAHAGQVIINDTYSHRGCGWVAHLLEGCRCRADLIQIRTIHEPLKYGQLSILDDAPE